jgi:hypothetical protein
VFDVNFIVLVVCLCQMFCITYVIMLIECFLQTVCMYFSGGHFIKYIAYHRITHKTKETTLAFYYAWNLIHNKNKQQLLAATIVVIHQQKYRKTQTKPG